jgi:hypothetical protein
MIIARGDGGEVVVIIFFIVIAIGAIAWHYSRSRFLLQQWAQENGYRILSSEHRHLVRGPFFWTTSKGQTVYRVEIQDRDGRTRSGWVRCGSWMLGLLSDKVQVRWDDEA